MECVDDDLSWTQWGLSVSQRNFCFSLGLSRSIECDGRKIVSRIVATHAKNSLFAWKDFQWTVRCMWIEMKMIFNIYICDSDKWHKRNSKSTIQSLATATRHCILISCIFVRFIFTVQLFHRPCRFHVETKESEYQRRPIVHLTSFTNKRMETWKTSNVAHDANERRRHAHNGCRPMRCIFFFAVAVATAVAAAAVCMVQYADTADSRMQKKVKSTKLHAVRYVCGVDAVVQTQYGTATAKTSKVIHLSSDRQDDETSFENVLVIPYFFVFAKQSSRGDRDSCATPIALHFHRRKGEESILWLILSFAAIAHQHRHLPTVLIVVSGWCFIDFCFRSVRVHYWDR